MVSAARAGMRRAQEIMPLVYHDQVAAGSIPAAELRSVHFRNGNECGVERVDGRGAPEGRSLAKAEKISVLPLFVVRKPERAFVPISVPVLAKMRPSSDVPVKRRRRCRRRRRWAGWRGRRRSTAAAWSSAAVRRRCGA